MKPAVLFVILMLTACAGLGTNMNDARNSWQGISYQDVVQQWGQPTRSGDAENGRKSHTWVSEGQMSRIVPSIGFFFGSSSGIGGEVTPQRTGPLRRCERTLIFQDEKVVEQTWTGDDNYCSTFIRY